jgi:hypothetical protein
MREIKRGGLGAGGEGRERRGDIIKLINIHLLYHYSYYLFLTFSN